MLCRNWRILDAKMAERMDTLRKLEEAWTVYLGRRRVERTLESLPIVQPPPPGPGIYHDDEEDGTERHMNGDSEAPAVPYGRDRPMVSVSSGWLKMRSSKVDAIDYYEGKLKQMDEQIKELRRGEYEPTSLAFVTLDSVAACVSRTNRLKGSCADSANIANGCSGCSRSITNASDRATKSCACGCCLEQYISAEILENDPSMVDHRGHHCSDNLLVLSPRPSRYRTQPRCNTPHLA